MIVGVGMDLIEIARVERLLADKGEHALRRLFHEEEVAYARGNARPAMHLAARLAAKEAAFKALAGTDEARLIGWREVRVARDGHGRPSLVFDGQAAVRVAELAVVRHWLTLTHTDLTAAAVVILEADAAGPVARG